MMKRVVAVQLLFFFGAVSGALAQSAAQFICNPKSQFTNIRSGPTARETQIVDRLPNKAGIKILERVKNPEGTHDWLRVEFKHSHSGMLSTGYVYQEIVSSACGDTASATASSAAPSTVLALPMPPLAKLEPELELILRGHGISVNSANFSPDGTRIVTASEDKTAKLWDTKKGALLATLSGHVEMLHSAAFSPDGSRIVTVSDDKTVKLWDTKSGSLLSTLSGHGVRMLSANFSPDGSWIVIAYENKIAKVWDTKTGVALVTLSGHGDVVRSAVFSPDGMRIVTSSWDRTAKVWSAKTGSVLATLSGHVEMLHSAAFSPDGSRIVTVSDDKTVKLWDTKSGSLLSTLNGHGVRVLSANFSPDGSRIVTTYANKTAKVWDTKTGVALATLSGHGDVVRSAVFSPDGGRIVTASDDETAKIWDAKTGSLLATLSGHGGWVRSASFSPDGTRIVTVSMDAAAKVWLILNREKAETLQKARIAEQEARNKRMTERLNALAALECERVKALDLEIKENNQLDTCVLNSQLKTGSARELYLTAAKFDASKERDKAKKLYQAIIERFPNDDLALKAATRITAIGDIENIEAAKAHTEKAKAEGQTKAEAEALARAARWRSEQERFNACSHVYVGKEIEQKVLGGFGLNIWSVVGFSPDSQRVTIRSKTVGGTQEVSCSQIPK